MKNFTTLLVATGAVLFVGLALPGNAKAAVKIPKSQYTESQVKADCPASFGTFFPSTSNNDGVYGCLYNGSGGVTCGGVGKYSDTCTISFTVPKRLPTQAELQEEKPAQSKTSK